MDIVSHIINSVSILGMVLVATAVLISSYNNSKLFFSASVYIAAVWLLLQYFVQAFSLNSAFGLGVIQFSSAISFAIAFLFYCFSRFYIGKKVASWVYLVAVLFFVVELSFQMSGLMIQSAHADIAGIIVDQATFLYQVYVIIVGLLFLTSLTELILANNKTKARKERARNHLVIFAFLQATLILAIGNIIFASSTSAQLLVPLSLLVMAVMVGLAIVRYQLFDIRSAVVRTLAYILSLITLSAVYYVLAYVISVLILNINSNFIVSVSPINIIPALLLAFIFQPVKKFFDKVTNRIFYKDNYNIDDFIGRLNNAMAVTTDLRNLLERVSKEMSVTLKGEQAFFFIYTTAAGNYITAGTSKHSILPRADAAMIEQKMDGEDKAIDAAGMSTGDPVRRMMISHKVELIQPLVKEGEIVGYLCLGEHLTSGGYTRRDIKALATVSDGLIIAIQNALAVQEIKEFTETLQQKVNQATQELRRKNAILRQLDKVKDEFMSIASHQLRTPLTSVKGYISMVLEGDAGKISEDQRKLLDQAYNSSENMVHLIADFLNVSRIQTGKFIIEKTTVDMPELVQQEVNGLMPNAKARHMRLVYDKPKDVPTVEIDEDKIKQVVMNFADNAIYYSHENTDINIDLKIESGNLIYTVKDHGIGVPAKARDQLFTKFFRADNARVQRPDGTGVGLFLAKKIIDSHGGEIIFDSVEGKGSTFGFRIPMKNLMPASQPDNLDNGQNNDQNNTSNESH